MRNYSVNIRNIFALLFVLIISNTVLAPFVVGSNLPKEKVIMITDRDIYLSGETIIFSASLFIDNEIDTELSKVIYVELFKDNNSYAKLKFKLIDGRTRGYINIPEGLLSGNYYLRSYTKYMINQGVESFFYKQITIINPERKLDNYDGKFSKPVLVSSQNDFLIANIENKGAVLFNKYFLKNIKESIVINSNDDSISKVTIYENGLGSFSFIPELNNNYSLKIYLKNNDTVYKKLNKVKPKGIVSSFNYQTSEAVIKQTVFSSHPMLKLYFSNGDGEIFTDKDFVVIDTTTKIKFHDLILPQEIIYMILADDNKILSVFPFYPFEKNNKSEISIISDNSFDKREKVDLSISGLSFSDEVTINVIKKQAVSAEILPIELIYNPRLVNSNAMSLNGDIAKQLQLSLILNQDSSIYKVWDKTISVEKPIQISKSDTEIVAETRDISISGKLVDKENSKPIVNQTVFASVFGKYPQIHSYKTGNLGRFVFSLNQIEGIEDVGITSDSIYNTDAEIIINNDFYTGFPEFNDYPVQLDSNSVEFITELYRNSQLNFKFRKIIKSEKPKIDKIPFPFQNPDFTFLLGDYVEFANLTEVFNEIITYVSVHKVKGKNVISVFDKRTKLQYDKPLYVLDNLIVFNTDELLKINPSQVEKIEVITKPYTLGSNNFQGIIMIYTKSGDFGGIKLPNATAFLKYITASPFTYFEYPNFSMEEIPSNQPYFANNIYNLSKTINDVNDNQFSFFTSDESGEFEIVVNIIKPDGTTIKATKTIEIR